ncbi:hypothetical protein VT06_14515 [Arsukibacterium sp. MJ3]|uniref:hypothetical protein n=1 Tax=Arsukibacterium sp. MJ3 TaxID=1632859 RepID=UPI000626FC3F|nr:hypothetical protein [Arsukibacterium sp. MJ3]KKO47894.1 hypothetical protein VT06_14515 [Arsukibacterium sp. MJ3]
MNTNRLITPLLLIWTALALTGCSLSPSMSVGAIVAKATVAEYMNSSGVEIEIVDYDIDTGLEKIAASGVFLGNFTDPVIFRNNNDDNGNGIPDDQDRIVNIKDDVFDMTAGDCATIARSPDFSKREFKVPILSHHLLDWES